MLPKPPRRHQKSERPESVFDKRAHEVNVDDRAAGTSLLPYRGRCRPHLQHEAAHDQQHPEAGDTIEPLQLFYLALIAAFKGKKGFAFAIYILWQSISPDQYSADRV